MNSSNLLHPKNNKVVYTSIFGDRDDLKPIVRQKGIDYVVFTDNPTLKSDDYSIILSPEIDIDPVRNARFYKINSDFVLKDYSQSLWIDASISCSVDNLNDLFESRLKNHDIAVHAHPKRNCIYEEASVCIKLAKDRNDIVNAQMEKYRNDNYPVAAGLVSSGLIFRRHSPAVNNFNRLWWNEILNHSRRDQLSFKFVAWKLGIEYFTIPGHVKNNDVEGFQFHKHKKKVTQSLPIY